jgi:hypothetical protein
MAAAALGAIAYSSCGDNQMFKEAARTAPAQSADETRLDDARARAAKGDEAQALALVTPLIEDPSVDSDEARLVYAEARLGAAGIPATGALTGKVDMARLLASVTEGGLGTGDARQGKLDALADAVATLLDAPNPDDHVVQNGACLVAALLAQPTLLDARAAEEAMHAGLRSAGKNCDDTKQLDQPATALVGLAANLNLIAEAAGSCPFFDIEAARPLVGDMQGRLAVLKDAADRGCQGLPPCPASDPSCGALFPSCVRQMLSIGTSSAVAGDGKIASCELVLHCLDAGLCFGS